MGGCSFRSEDVAAILADADAKAHDRIAVNADHVFNSMDGIAFAEHGNGGDFLWNGRMFDFAARQ